MTKSMELRADRPLPKGDQGILGATEDEVRTHSEHVDLHEGTSMTTMYCWLVQIPEPP
jgi:hypothetical protein